MVAKKQLTPCFISAFSKNQLVPLCSARQRGAGQQCPAVAQTSSPPSLPLVRVTAGTGRPQPAHLFMQHTDVLELLLRPSRCALAPLFWLSEKGRLNELTRATPDFTCHAPAHAVTERTAECAHCLPSRQYVRAARRLASAEWTAKRQPCWKLQAGPKNSARGCSLAQDTHRAPGLLLEAEERFHGRTSHLQKSLQSASACFPCLTLRARAILCAHIQDFLLKRKPAEHTAHRFEVKTSHYRRKARKRRSQSHICWGGSSKS